MSGIQGKTPGRTARSMTRGVLLAAALLVTASPGAFAGGPPYGIPSGVMQWDWYKYRGYNEPNHAARVPPADHAAIDQAPAKYSMHLTHLKVKHDADDPNIVVLMAHLPEDAALYFDGVPTQQAGKLRWFETPALVPGYDYHYTVKAVWFEDGKWVAQSRSLNLRAGEAHCIDIVPGGAKGMAAEIDANLAKLSPEDRKLAQAQKYCVIQTDKRLGEMGVPIKVQVNGQSVFLCCDGCERAALSNPGRTLAKAELLRAKKRDDRPSE